MWYSYGMPVYTVRGRLSQGRIVELETPLPMESADVEVVISVPSDSLTHNWRESLQQIWTSLEAVGHHPPSPEEIAYTLKELRTDRDIRDANLP